MPYPGVNGGKVHKGFYHSYLGIAKAVNRAARSLLAQCQRCHVYITGHSLVSYTQHIYSLYIYIYVYSFLCQHLI